MPKHAVVMKYSGLMFTQAFRLNKEVERHLLGMTPKANRTNAAVPLENVAPMIF